MAGASCHPAGSRQSMLEDDGCFRLIAAARVYGAEYQLLVLQSGGRWSLLTRRSARHYGS
jgi:hypothetical protein